MKRSSEIIVLGHSPPTRVRSTRIFTALDKPFHIPCKRVVSGNALEKRTRRFFEVFHSRFDRVKRDVGGYLSVFELAE